MVHVEDVTVNNKLDTGLFWIHLDIHKTIFIVSQIIRRISCELKNLFLKIQRK